MEDKINKKTRVRFAPSPTGNLHVGTARAVLFNYFYARKEGGVVVFRSEDTDKERSKKEYENDIIRSLKWLDLDWDEGITLEGEKGAYGPYRQSERGEIYREKVKKLLEKGLAYYCFCNKESLEKMREEQRQKKEPPRYEGRCFSLKKEERDELIKKGGDFVVRIRVPEGKIISFKDKIRGEVKFSSNDIGGDFVIARKDFSPLYNFACAVDDAKMEITHVIRGEDHISNTPKQIIVHEALGADIPIFAHLPLLLGQDKSKLSKRHGATSVLEYKEKGYLSEALLNFIALLGWHPGGNEEIYSVKEIIEKFSLKDCQKSGAVFDIKKLDYINGHYIRKKNIEDLTKLCIPYLIKEGLVREDDVSKDNYFLPKKNETVKIEHLVKVISLYQERMKKLSEVGELVDYLLMSDIKYEKELLFWKKSSKEETLIVLEDLFKTIESIDVWEKEKVEEVLFGIAEEKGDRGSVLWPLRAALSGKKASASPFDIIMVLGKDEALKRLKIAKNKLLG